MTSDIAIQYRGYYNAPPITKDGFEFGSVQLERPCTQVRNTFSGDVPWHLTRDQITYIPASASAGVALDHGCGTAPHRRLLEGLGYRYHGIDFESPDAQDLVDVHALPYRADVFDLVLSVGVLDQLEQPLLAFAEIRRVLKPGGHLIGTVPFLEPFHGHGCFNFTHLGLSRTLERSGFAVDAILCIRGWNAIRAQLHMGFDWRLPGRLADWLSRPFMWALDLYGAVGRRFARNRQGYDRNFLHARHAGAFFFAARKRAVEIRPSGAVTLPSAERIVAPLA